MIPSEESGTITRSDENSSDENSSDYNTNDKPCAKLNAYDNSRYKASDEYDLKTM